MTAMRPTENLVKSLSLILFSKKKTIPKQMMPMTYITIRASLTVVSVAAIPITSLNPLYVIPDNY